MGSLWDRFGIDLGSILGCVGIILGSLLASFSVRFSWNGFRFGLDLIQIDQNSFGSVFQEFLRFDSEPLFLNRFDSNDRYAFYKTPPAGIGVRGLFGIAGGFKVF